MPQPAHARIILPAMCATGEKGAGTAYAFQEFPWLTEEPDPRNQRLCRETAAPDRASDRINIRCRIEGASFAPAHVPPQDEITLMAYNIERGYRAAEQIDLLLNDRSIPAPDVILLSEADRGCSRTGYRNVIRDYARALGMCYVFGVEFIELPRIWGAGRRIKAACEHGNGILSRYPLGNVRLIRHRVNKAWYNRALRALRIGQPRLGGRMAISADVKIGDNYLHVYSLHFESRGGSSYRRAQAVELAEDGLTKPYNVVIGGDTNAALYLSDLRRAAKDDPTTQAFFERGYVDAHAGLAPSERITAPPDGVIDLIFGRGQIFSGAGVGHISRWGGLSDHLPVWAKVRVD